MNLNPYDVVHFCVKVRTGSETWEGNAFYAKPVSPGHWSVLTSGVMTDLWNALPEIVDVNKAFRFAVEADCYTVHGLMAKAMRNEREKVLRGERPAFTWDPIMSERLNVGRKGVNRG